MDKFVILPSGGLLNVNTIRYVDTIDIYSDHIAFEILYKNLKRDDACCKLHFAYKHFDCDKETLKAKVELIRQRLIKLTVGDNVENLSNVIDLKKKP